MQVALDASKVVADVLILTPAAAAAPVVKAAAEATEAKLAGLAVATQRHGATLTLGRTEKGTGLVVRVEFPQAG